MKKKVVWMVAALLLTSCAPAVVGEQPEKAAPKQEVPKEKVAPEVAVPGKAANMVKWTGTKLDGTVVEKMIEKPKYGGVHITAKPSEPPGWDAIMTERGYNWATNGLVIEGLIQMDWARGLAGTGEWLVMQGHDPVGPVAGAVAESWEVVDDQTIVFQIRKGIHFALNPDSEASQLVGGRELTAADVAANAVRWWTVGFGAFEHHNLADMENPANSIYVSPDDPWKVVYKLLPGKIAKTFYQDTSAQQAMNAPEVVEKYGDLTDWKNLVGTESFYLKEYMAASSITYERNPNYWGYDPFFPENQLPYVDTFKVLIIPDRSTQMAALRTGRIDYLVDVGTDKTELDTLLSYNPEIESQKLEPGGGGTIWMRYDQPEQPWADVRVRRALAMAINNPEIRDLYWEGDAALFTYPVSVNPDVADYYIPLEKMPQSVQELYGYHPDKARQLLADAGYPEGFKAEIITKTDWVDILSIVKENWADIGVDLDIQVKDHAVWRTIGKKKEYPSMYMYTGLARPLTIITSAVRVKGGGNYGKIADPWHAIMFAKWWEVFFDREKKIEVLTTPMAEGVPSWPVYVNEQVWLINLPQPWIYNVWQPWLKGVFGIADAAHKSDLGYAKHAWIDQELKKTMTR